MPIIAYKEQIKHGNAQEKICLAFNCEYEESGFLRIKNYQPNYFDSGDFRIKIEEAIKRFNH